MFSKIVVISALVACISAIDDHDATSYAAFNQNHNSVQHIQSAPALVKYAAPAAHVYAAPAASVYAAPAAYGYAAPAITKVIPSVKVAQYATPAASSYSSYSQHSSPVAHYAAPSFAQYTTAPVAQYAAPVAQYAAPVAQYAAPVAQYAAPVAQYAAPVAQYTTVAKVAPVAYAAPLAKYAAAPAYSAHQEEYAHPKYEYAYNVEDHHTGDFHSQQEQRDGDHVVGQYSLHEADGTVRIVKYYDDGHGFNAVVEKQGQATEAPAVLKKVIVPVAKAVVAAPQYQHY